MKKIIANLFIIFVSTMIGLIIAEFGIRSFGHWDEDGQFYFNDKPVVPFVVPVSEIQKTMDKLSEKDPSEIRIISDESLGWTNNPNFVPSGGLDSLYRISSQGLRGKTEYNLTPADDTLRIALFGDSFTFGGEVDNDETWSVYLETALAERGIKAEVLNFGVSGYGMDQAYLRWEYDGIEFQPDIILFGFSPFDIRRNTNLFRSLVDLQTPLAKPRFIIEDDTLKLIHQPVTPQNEIVNVLTNFYLNPLSQYEGYYDSRFSQKWWLESKLIALMINTISPPLQERSIGSVTPDELDLTERIVIQFGDDVTQQNSEFIVVHLPGRIHLEYLLRNGDLGYFSSLENIKQDYPVWHFESVLSESKPSYWQPGNHYSPEMNQLLANFTADQLISCLDDTSCMPPRFISSSDFRPSP